MRWRAHQASIARGRLPTVSACECCTQFRRHGSPVGDSHDSDCVYGQHSGPSRKERIPPRENLRIRIRAGGDAAASRCVWMNSPYAKLRWIGGDVHDPLTILCHCPVLCIHAIVGELAYSRTVTLRRIDFIMTTPIRGVDDFLP